MPTDKTEKIKLFFEKHRLDIAVIAVLLTVSLSLMLVFSLTKEEGSTVEVEIDGAKTAVYSLSDDGEYILCGGTNTLVIKDGSAYMINSHCPDHTCEQTGKIHLVGERIVCLPNKIAVTVKGGESGSIDFVS